MTDNKELYAFGDLRHYLNSKGIHVREPYAPIDPNDKEYYKGGKHLTFGKDGIYLELPDGSKQKVFLYRPSYFKELPPFHIFACPSVKDNIRLIGSAFMCGNTDQLPGINLRNKNNVLLSQLPICGYCAEKPRLSKKYNTNSYVKLIKTGRSINDVEIDDTLATHTKDWMRVRENYLKKIRYKCERCGRIISDEYDQAQYLVVMHLDHNPENNDFRNLKCYCLDCLSIVRQRSVWVNGANKQMLTKYRKKYLL